MIGTLILTIEIAVSAFIGIFVMESLIMGDRPKKKKITSYDQEIKQQEHQGINQNLK
jgi:hypothetical protein